MLCWGALVVSCTGTGCVVTLGHWGQRYSALLRRKSGSELSLPEQSPTFLSQLGTWRPTLPGITGNTGLTAGDNGPLRL